MEEEYSKQRKDMARKRSKSGMGKAVQTGQRCDIFTVYVYWNPTYKCLDGAMHLPEGMKIPDVNGYLRGLANSQQQPTRRRQRRTTRRPQMPPQTKSNVPHEITVETDSDDSSSDAQMPDEQQSPVVVIHREPTCDTVREASCDQRSIAEAVGAQEPVGSTDTSDTSADDATLDDQPMEEGAGVDQDCLMVGDTQMGNDEAAGDSSRVLYGKPTRGATVMEHDAPKDSNAQRGDTQTDMDVHIFDIGQVYEAPTALLRRTTGPVRDNRIDDTEDSQVGLSNTAQMVVALLREFKKAIRA